MFNHQYLKRCVQSEVVYRDDTCTIQKVKHKHNGYKQEQGCGVHGNKCSYTYDKVAKFMNICQHSIIMTVKHNFKY